MQLLSGLTLVGIAVKTVFRGFTKVPRTAGHGIVEGLLFPGLHW